MANQEHIALIQQGVDSWNSWRRQNSEVQPDLFGANLFRVDVRNAELRDTDLRGANLREADLSGADLSWANGISASLTEAKLVGAKLSRADLRGANFSGADLSNANLFGANLFGANLFEAKLLRVDLREADLGSVNLLDSDLSGADLSGADLSGADLFGANLTGANLTGADLGRTTLIDTNLTKATLKDCSIYGISAWDVQLDGAEQLNLIITPKSQPTITVDNLKIAQFIYLLLNNREIRDAIDTIARKAALILGRFTDKRKPILEAIRTELRLKGYLPILFDFDKPNSLDLTETVNTLAHLSRFIIADLTDPSSVPHELSSIIPNHVVPIVPLFHPTDQARHEYAMFLDFKKRYQWVLPIRHYTAVEDLLPALQTQIIDPAEKKAQELITLKNTSEAEL